MNIRPFRFWCYKVLPLVYDDSLSYYEVLCKVVKYINEMLEELEASEKRIDGLDSAIKQLREYVDHYFDNLDVQEEINNKLDEMAESGALDDIIGEWLYRTPLNEIIDSDVYGQMCYSGMYDSDNNYYPQGFTIFRLNGAIYSAVGRVNSNANPDLCKLMITELSYDADGRLNGTNSTPYNIEGLGHCNSMTFCYEDNLLYIACGGGDNGIAKIVAINPLTLEVVKTFDYTYDVELQNCTGIAWDDVNKVFYVGERGYLMKFDKDMHYTGVRKPYFAPMCKGGDTVGQSFFTDGRYIYLIYGVGTPADVNVIMMYNCLNLELYKKAMVLVKGECEGGVYFDSKYFVNNSRNRNCLIYELYPYADRNVGNYNYRGYTRSAIIARAEQNNSNDLYCDSDYNGFRVDGTNSTYPFNSVYNMLDNAFDKMDSIRIEFHVAGNQPHMFNIKKYTTMSIIGYTGYGASGSIPGLYIRNGLECNVRNIKVTAPNGISDSYIAFIDTNQFALDNVVIEGTTQAGSLLVYPFSNGNIRGCTFNAPYTDWVINSPQGGNVIIGDNVFPINPTNGNYDIYTNELTILPRLDAFNVKYYQVNPAYSVATIPASEDFDITKIRRHGLYRIVRTGGTFVNIPTAITENFTFECKNMAGASIGAEGLLLIVYELVTNSGVYYKGIYCNDTITWYDITGATVATFYVGT